LIDVCDDTICWLCLGRSLCILYRIKFETEAADMWHGMFNSSISARRRSAPLFKLYWQQVHMQLILDTHSIIAFCFSSILVQYYF